MIDYLAGLLTLIGIALCFWWRRQGDLDHVPTFVGEPVDQSAANEVQPKRGAKSKKKKSAKSDSGTADASNDDSKVVSLDAFRKK